MRLYENDVALTPRLWLSHLSFGLPFSIYLPRAPSWMLHFHDSIYRSLLSSTHFKTRLHLLSSISVTSPWLSLSSSCQPPTRHDLAHLPPPSLPPLIAADVQIVTAADALPP